MQSIILKQLRERIAQEIGSALADALIHESHGAKDAAAGYRAHAERLTAVLAEYDRLEQQAATPTTPAPQTTWGTKS